MHRVSLNRLRHLPSPFERAGKGKRAGHAALVRAFPWLAEVVTGRALLCPRDTDSLDGTCQVRPPPPPQTGLLLPVMHSIVFAGACLCGKVQPTFCTSIVVSMLKRAKCSCSKGTLRSLFMQIGRLHLSRHLPRCSELHTRRHVEVVCEGRNCPISIDSCDMKLPDLLADVLEKLQSQALGLGVKH